MSVVVAEESFESWPSERLESEITLVAAHLAAGECRWLQMVEAFDRREVWASWGCASAAHWLNWKCGLAIGAARERVRVARRLAELPLVTAAFAVGELSYSKTRAVTRVATEANEETLVDLARSMTASHLERTVRCYKQVTGDAYGEDDSSPDLEKQYQARYLSTWWNEDGTLSIKATLPPAEGEVVLAALRRAADSIYHRRPDEAGDDNGHLDPSEVPAGTRTDSPSDVPAGTRTDSPSDVPAGTRTDSPSDVPAGTRTDSPSDDNNRDDRPPDVPAGTSGSQDVAAESPRPFDRWEARQADALVAMAETVVADGLRPGSGPNRHTVVIHTDAAEWAGATDFEGAGHLDDGPPLAMATVRRLMCDASLTFALDGPDGTVVNVSPRAPSVPASLARAIKLRDRACVFPGCTRQSFVDIHHIRHRIDGGENSRLNLALLCRVHHRMVHEGGYTMTSDGPGQFRFQRPDGSPLNMPATRVGPGDDSLRDFNAAHGVAPSDKTTAADWDGSRPNYAMIIDLLLSVDGRIPFEPPCDN